MTMTDDKAITKRTIDPELAKRLHRALTAGGDELHGVLQDPAPEVLRSALKNRHLGEEHLLALLKRRDLGEDLLKAIYQLPATADSHRLRLALVRNPGTPGTVILTLLPRLHLFELIDLCYLPGVTPDQKFAAERAILQRLPTTELGNKLTVARRATAAVVGEMLRDGDPRLVEICLTNPHLREMAVLQFLNGPTASPETISMVGRHQKWQMRPNLRMAMLKNPRTPEIWYIQFLPGLRSPDLRNLLMSRRLTPRQRTLVEEELKRRGGR
jgi:hypothetical protein